MKTQFADFDTSKKLKELGFDEECMGWFENQGNVLPKSGCTYEYGITKNNLHEVNTLAHLWQQVEEFLWEKHKIWIEIQESDRDEFSCYIQQNDNIIGEENGNRLHVNNVNQIFSHQEKDLDGQLPF